MNIVVAFKVVPDDQDIMIAADQSLDFSKAAPIISAYDLNALEAAAQLAATQEGSKVIAVTVGSSSVDDSKLKKNVLSRGVDELVMLASDATANLDSHATASALSAVLAGVDFDLVICGDGSADNYAQQVDVQLAALLACPFANGVTKIIGKGALVELERTLEDLVETVEINLPAVVSVTPDIALPRIPGMKDILAAGKKPMNMTTVSGAFESDVQVLSSRAPEQVNRKLEILDLTADGAIEKFAAALKAAS